MILILLSPIFVLAQKKGELSNQQQVILTKKYIDADRQRILGNYQEAFELYTECILIDPENDAAHYEIGRLYQEQRQLAQAEAMFKKASKLDPENKWYLMNLSEVLAEQDKLKESAKVYESLRALEPKNPEHILMQANLLLYAGEPKKALKAYDDFEKIAGITKEVSLRKFRFFVGAGKYDDAANEMQRLIDVYPNDSQLYSNLADLYKAQGKIDKALEVYEKALEVDPNNPYIQLSLAEYYDRNSQQDESIDFLKKAYANSDLDIDTKVGVLLKMYNDAQKYEEVRNKAVDLCEILANTHPDEAKSYSVYGDFLYLDEQWDGARTQYRKAIDLDPSKFALWSQLLLLDSELDDDSAMLADSKAAMELFPAQPSVYLFNGIANNERKNYAEAAKSLRIGSQLVIGNAFLSSQMLASLGDAYHELDRPESSDSAYEASLGFDPNNLYVLNNYSYFLSLRGEKLERALEMSAQTVERAPNNASYLDTHGWVLFKLGRFEEAEGYLKKSLEKGGDTSGEVLEHYGDTIFKLGRADDALEYWQRAKETGDASESIDDKISSKSLND